MKVTAFWQPMRCLIQSRGYLGKVSPYTRRGKRGIKQYWGEEATASKDVQALATLPEFPFSAWILRTSFSENAKNRDMRRKKYQTEAEREKSACWNRQALNIDHPKAGLLSTQFASTSSDTPHRTIRIHHLRWRLSRSRFVLISPVIQSISKE